jgi:hypothetical protein
MLQYLRSVVCRNRMRIYFAFVQSSHVFGLQIGLVKLRKAMECNAGAARTAALKLLSAPHSLLSGQACKKPKPISIMGLDGSALFGDNLWHGKC